MLYILHTNSRTIIIICGVSLAYTYVRFIPNYWSLGFNIYKLFIMCTMFLTHLFCVSHGVPGLYLARVLCIYLLCCIYSLSCLVVYIPCIVFIVFVVYCVYLSSYCYAIIWSYVQEVLEMTRSVVH